MLKRFKSLIFMSIAVLIISSFLPALTTNAQATEQLLPISQINEFAETEEFFDIIDKTGLEFLYAIEQMPEPVIEEGTQAIFDWLKENVTDEKLLSAIEEASTLNPNELEISTASIACGVAIATGIATLVFAPAKILKIKKAVEALGGAYKLANTAVKYYRVNRSVWKLGRIDSWQKAIDLATKQLAPDLKDTVFDLLGATAVITACSID